MQLLHAFAFGQDYNWKRQQVDVSAVTRNSTRARTAIASTAARRLYIAQSCIYARGTM